jgi:hypothetical protein
MNESRQSGLSANILVQYGLLIAAIITYRVNETFVPYEIIPAFISLLHWGLSLMPTAIMILRKFRAARADLVAMALAVTALVSPLAFYIALDRLSV